MGTPEMNPSFACFLVNICTVSSCVFLLVTSMSTYDKTARPTKAMKIYHMIMKRQTSPLPPSKRDEPAGRNHSSHDSHNKHATGSSVTTAHISRGTKSTTISPSRSTLPNRPKSEAVSKFLVQSSLGSSRPSIRNKTNCNTTFGIRTTAALAHKHHPHNDSHGGHHHHHHHHPENKLEKAHDHSTHHHHLGHNDHHGEPIRHFNKLGSAKTAVKTTSSTKVTTRTSILTATRSPILTKAASSTSTSTLSATISLAKASVTRVEPKTSTNSLQSVITTVKSTTATGVSWTTLLKMHETTRRISDPILSTQKSKDTTGLSVTKPTTPTILSPTVNKKLGYTIPTLSSTSATIKSATISTTTSHKRHTVVQDHITGPTPSHSKDEAFYKEEGSNNVVPIVSNGVKMNSTYSEKHQIKKTVVPVPSGGKNNSSSKIETKEGRTTPLLTRNSVSNQSAASTGVENSTRYSSFAQKLLSTGKAECSSTANLRAVSSHHKKWASITNREESDVATPVRNETKDVISSTVTSTIKSLSTDQQESATNHTFDQELKNTSYSTLNATNTNIDDNNTNFVNTTNTEFPSTRNSFRRRGSRSRRIYDSYSSSPSSASDDWQSDTTTQLWGIDNNYGGGGRLSNDYYNDNLDGNNWDSTTQATDYDDTSRSSYDNYDDTYSTNTQRANYRNRDAPDYDNGYDSSTVSTGYNNAYDDRNQDRYEDDYADDTSTRSTYRRYTSDDDDTYDVNTQSAYRNYPSDYDDGYDRSTQSSYKSSTLDYDDGYDSRDSSETSTGSTYDAFTISYPPSTATTWPDDSPSSSKGTDYEDNESEYNDSTTRVKITTKFSDASSVTYARTKRIKSPYYKNTYWLANTGSRRWKKRWYGYRRTISLDATTNPYKGSLTRRRKTVIHESVTRVAEYRYTKNDSSGILSPWSRPPMGSSTLLDYYRFRKVRYSKTRTFWENLKHYFVEFVRLFKKDYRKDLISDDLKVEVFELPVPA